jgi:hypothetical protein
MRPADESGEQSGSNGERGAGHPRRGGSGQRVDRRTADLFDERLLRQQPLGTHFDVTHAAVGMIDVTLAAGEELAADGVINLVFGRVP